jgi:hypothetical protein
MRWSQSGHNPRHNMAHTYCMLDKQGQMRERIHTHTRTDAQAHTHTDKYVILFTSPLQELFRERSRCYVIRNKQPVYLCLCFG